MKYVLVLDLIEVFLLNVNFFDEIQDVESLSNRMCTTIVNILKSGKVWTKLYYNEYANYFCISVIHQTSRIDKRNQYSWRRKLTSLMASFASNGGCSFASTICLSVLQPQQNVGRWAGVD